MTRLSKIARKRKAAGARPGKMRKGVIEARVEKLCEVAGSDKSVQHWTKCVQNDWKAIRTLQKMVKAKKKAPKAGKPIVVKLEAFAPAAGNAMHADYANRRFFRKF
jgi:hypothetical protein